MEAGGVSLRPAVEADVPALAELYGWHVAHGSGTFEEVPPPAAEMAVRLAKVRAAGLPYIVAETGVGVAGFACASPYNGRSAYRYTAEDSIYVAEGSGGRGVGRALLSELIDRCAAAGLRQLVAAIGDSQNLASIALHRRLGFQHAGVLKDVGFKHGRNLDVVWMQRSL